MPSASIVNILLTVGAALLGFAAGYGSLRAMVSEFRENMKGLRLEAKETSAALAMVTADARHYQALLAQQGSEIVDLRERLRIVELDVATLKASA